MHFDDGLADKSGAKEGPKGDKEVATRDASQVKQRVRDLKSSTTLFNILSITIPWVVLLFSVIKIIASQYFLNLPQITNLFYFTYHYIFQHQ